VASRLQGLSLEGNENLVLEIFKNVHLPNLRLFDMAQVSSNIMKGFLHDRHLYELRWIQWQEAEVKNTIQFWSLSQVACARFIKLHQHKSITYIY
jgi:hypothetical protein